MNTACQSRISRHARLRPLRSSFMSVPIGACAVSCAFSVLICAQQQDSNPSNPTALPFDSSDNLFVASYPNTILKFDADGTKSIFASGAFGSSGLAFGKADDLFALDGDSSSIVKFTPDGTKSVAEEEEKDSSTGLPDKFSKKYLVVASTISLDKKFAVICPRLEAEEAAEEANQPERIKDYLVSLHPFQIVGELPTKFPYFEHENHGNLSVEWSGDSSIALITLDAKWGPRDVFLVEFHDGKLGRMTNIARKAHDLLVPNYRKARAARYNDLFDFVFVEDTTFKLEGTGRVLIDASAETSPNITDDVLRSSDRAWRGHVEAVWDIPQAKFISNNVSGRLRKRSKSSSEKTKE